MLLPRWSGSIIINWTRESHMYHSSARQKVTMKQGMKQRVDENFPKEQKQWKNKLGIQTNILEPKYF